MLCKFIYLFTHSSVYSMSPIVESKANADNQHHVSSLLVSAGLASYVFVSSVCLGIYIRKNPFEHPFNLFLLFIVWAINIFITIVVAYMTIKKFDMSIRVSLLGNPMQYSPSLMLFSMLFFLVEIAMCTFGVLYILQTNFTWSDFMFAYISILIPVVTIIVALLGFRSLFVYIYQKI